MRMIMSVLGMAVVVNACHAASNADVAACGDSSGITLISSIQGNGSASPMTGTIVVVDAIVTRVSNDGSDSAFDGFWLQEQSADSDNDASTSEGIFVYDRNLEVAVGDQVRLAATVAEYNTLTELKTVTDMTVCSSGNELPEAQPLVLPVSEELAFEALEGMRIVASESLLVSDFYGTGYGFGNYGQLVVSSALQFQPTELAAPGSDQAAALSAGYAFDRLLVDDGSAETYPAFIPFPDAVNGYGVDNPVRIGDTVDELSGVMHVLGRHYAVIPATYTITATHPRSSEPSVSEDANLRIASMNVLNYFNGDGEGGGFPTARGAKTQAAFQMQSDKIVAAIDAMDAGVVGLMEIENDGFTADSAIQYLVDELNALQAEGDEYQFVNPQTASGVIGTDAIAVGLLYRPAVVTATGTTVVLDSSNSPTDDDGVLFRDDKNRPSLIQSFSFNDQTFTVSVNHLKSKGSACDEASEGEDGQGNCNQTRTRAASGLLQFLQQRPTGVESDANLIMGDLNAYRMEDPVQTLLDGGYVNLKTSQAATEAQPYSYSYSGLLGSLDHALATQTLADWVVSAGAWHINSVEDSLMDYETETNGQSYRSVDNYANADPYRSSDHDPVVIGLRIEAAAAETPVDEDDSDTGSDGSADDVTDDVTEDTADNDSTAEQASDSDSSAGASGWVLLLLAAAALRARRRA
ncbi:ExeM/NucH family extracellular endonuclease [Oceanobacter kriegii]|uniref:ExeM/NucH family extracellular endonuclease n=1 Tax=Oceanobacter kriegii TaxID=64972 RepID=UPI0004187E1E|nr:ExeM/NucH family extracellular endonuclease [Oceanobacter kriegii]